MKHEITLETLENFPLFQDLTQSEFDLLINAAEVKSFASGDKIIMERAELNVACVVLEGSVRICVSGEDGREVIVAIRGRGEVVGELNLIDGLGRSARVIAHEAATLLCFDHITFWRDLWEIPPISYNLTRILARRLRSATAREQIFATTNPKRRVMHQIQFLAQEYGETRSDGSVHIPFRLTTADLAAMTSVPRSHVRRVLAHLTRHHHITIDKNQHITLSRESSLSSPAPQSK